MGKDPRRVRAGTASRLVQRLTYHKVVGKLKTLKIQYKTCFRGLCVPVPVVFNSWRYACRVWLATCFVLNTANFNLQEFIGLWEFDCVYLGLLIWIRHWAATSLSDMFSNPVYTDTEFAQVFYTTFRLFMTPEQFLDELIARWVTRRAMLHPTRALGIAKHKAI